MKVKILRSTVASGKRVEKGQVVDLSDSDGKFLVAIKKARNVEDKNKHVANGKP
jgi:hypothetical protein